MKYAFEFEFDEAFLRRALRRDIVWRWIYVLLLFSAMLAWLWYRWGVFPVEPAKGLGAAAGVLGLWLAYQLRRGARNLLSFWSRQSPERVMRFELEDDAFHVTVGSSSSRYEWQGLRRLWRYSDIWVIEIVRRVSVFFPPDAAPDEVREFIVERCRQGGART